ncbi:MAG TPA: MFS transporter [Candidatus Nanopelagicaceae bacterium]|nr:MFS transporter [Candidatus Nanopelagicaceae bacterium]
MSAPDANSAMGPAPTSSGPRRGSGRIAVLATTSLAHFINDGTVFFIPVMADLLASRGSLSAALITAMLTIFYLTSSGAGILVGRLADKGGGRGAKIAIGILSLGVGMFLFAVAIAWTHGAARGTLSIVAALVAGVGSSFYHPLGASLISDAFDPSNRARALGANGAMGSLGRALYPTLFFVVTGLVASQASAVVVFGVVAAGAAALLWTVRVDPRQPRVEGAATATDPVTPGPWLDRNIVILTVVSFVRSVAFTGMVAWLPVYFTHERGLGLSSELGLVITLLYAGGVLGQPLFGLFADKLDKRMVLAVSTLGAAGAAIAYVHNGGALGLALLGIFGVFNFSGFPLLMSLVADYVPKGTSSTANAFVWGLGSTGGQAIGPLLVGLLALSSYSHLASSFEILALAAIAVTALLPLMARTGRHTRPPLFG